VLNFGFEEEVRLKSMHIHPQTLLIFIKGKTLKKKIIEKYLMGMFIIN